jgi:hypothetical protein
MHVLHVLLLRGKVANCVCDTACCHHRSSKLWSFYADLEESLGTLESAAGVYDKMLDLKVATPQMILNYALMLQVRTVWACGVAVGVFFPGDKGRAALCYAELVLDCIELCCAVLLFFARAGQTLPIPCCC